MAQKPEQSYDNICFTELAYDFNNLDSRKIEEKIKRRLKYYKLADYEKERVDYIMQLKNDLFTEISLQSKSKYFNKSSSDYADLADFDLKKMNIDFSEKYDQLTDANMIRILNIAVYLYYMR